MPPPELIAFGSPGSQQQEIRTPSGWSVSANFGGMNHAIEVPSTIKRAEDEYC